MEIINVSSYLEMYYIENGVVQRVTNIEIYNMGNCIIQSTTINTGIYNPGISTMFPVSQHRELSIVLI